MVPRDLPRTSETNEKVEKEAIWTGRQSSYARKPEGLSSKGILHMDWLESI